MNLIKYFENMTYFFEEDVVSIDINKNIKFINAKKFLNTEISQLRNNTCYASKNHTGISGNTNEPGFTIKIFDENKNTYYFYNFYYTSHDSNVIKLVFGIAKGTDAITGETITLNDVTDKQIRGITLNQVRRSHTAKVKIDIPINVRNIFFNAILKYTLNYGIITKDITYRGHLEPDEIPFTNLASQINNSNNESINEIGETILKTLNFAESYANKIMKNCEDFVKNNKNLIVDYDNKNPEDKKIPIFKKITLDQNIIDQILIDISPTIFLKIHGSGMTTTYGRGGITLSEFKKYINGKTLNELYDFYKYFLEKIIFFKKEIKEIEENDPEKYIRKFNLALVKLRSNFFHRDKLYRLIVRRILKMNTLLKDEKIFDFNDKIEDPKILKDKILNNIIEMLKRKKVTAKIKINSEDGRVFNLTPKNFELNLYNQTLDFELKNYFDLIDDKYFIEPVLKETVKSIQKDLSNFIINSIIVNNPTGWVDINTSSKILNDVSISNEN